jgi:cellulase
VDVGAPTGVTTHVPWSTWIVNSVVTSASAGEVVGSSRYTPSWSAVYATPTAGAQRW